MRNMNIVLCPQGAKKKKKKKMKKKNSAHSYANGGLRLRLVPAAGL
jgi:hypothetical protein